MTKKLNIKFATPEDAPLIVSFIRELAEFEKHLHVVRVTEKTLFDSLFVENPRAEVIIGYYQNAPVCFSLFSYNFSIALGQPGIYLEALFVKPNYRKKGFGKNLLSFLAMHAKEKNCCRLSFSTFDWNNEAIHFYQNLGARAMEQLISFRLGGEALDKLAEELVI